MAKEVRRIVTGHDANGKAVIKTDERLAAVSRLGRPHIAGCEIWSTDRMPADNSEATDAAQRKGFVTRYNYVGTGQGTVIRITEFAPGAPTFMHRTETVDYALLLSGECDLELDSGEVAHLKPGDVVVQRGAMHAWVNNGTTPLRVRLHPDRCQPGYGGGPGTAHAFSGTLGAPRSALPFNPRRRGRVRVGAGYRLSTTLRIAVLPLLTARIAVRIAPGSSAGRSTFWPWKPKGLPSSA